MIEESRIAIYEYLYDLFYNVVTKNVYSMQEPQELTQSDVKDGFIVLHVGGINDESEFVGQAYGWVRCYVEVFVPMQKRGKLDYDLYETLENSVNGVVKAASEESDGTYNIQEDSLLSADYVESNNSDNQFFTFVKSFIVNIDKKGV